MSNESIVTNGYVSTRNIIPASLSSVLTPMVE
jgi:hypothetical protein